MYKKMCELSIVIPVFNEEKNIGLLYKKLVESLKAIGRTYEIIFVDDGSSDNSFSLLKQIHENDASVKVLKLFCNMGKAVAYSAGFDAAKGEIIITMDADLQDDPQDIKALLDKLYGGYDMVTGWKYTGKGTLMKTVPSRIFNGFVRFITGIHVHDLNCPFKAYRRNVLKGLYIYGDLYRFITLILASKGYKIAEVKIKNYPRNLGKTKYGVSRFGKGFLDFITVIFITKYASRPLHFFGLIGSAIFFCGFGIDAYITMRGLLVGRIGHSAMLLFGVLLMITGIQLISIGIIAELMINLNRKEERDFNIELILDNDSVK